MPKVNWEAVGALATLFFGVIEVALNWERIKEIWASFRAGSIGRIEAIKRVLVVVMRRVLPPIIVIFATVSLAIWVQRNLLIQPLHPLLGWIFWQCVLAITLVILLALLLAYTLLVDPRRRAEKALDLLMGEQEVPSHPPEVPPSVKRVASNDLGNGVRMGGLCQGVSLKLVSSAWARWYDNGWVKSGWLYMPPKSDLSHAVAFFKVHLNDEGDGWVHILAASNTVHKIWLETDAGSREEHEFKWGDSLDALRALWPFRWKRLGS
jgi:hypothetical protein